MSLPKRPCDPIARAKLVPDPTGAPSRNPIVRGIVTASGAGAGSRYPGQCRNSARGLC